MKRSTIHLFFSVFAACLAVLSLWQAYRLYSNQETIQAITAVPDQINDRQYQPAAEANAGVLLATASALSMGGQFESAETLLVKLVGQQEHTPLGQASQFNLANHYLRRGIRTDLPGAQTRPLIEIAKQRYRDLLQSNPDDWDARVNLEHALRHAPEIASEDRDKGPPIKSVDVVVPDFKLKDLP
ncbi:hypothetical protein AB833_20810 [Chromatiales bacterium (ex Bugula neritina AB1)]|nr:hypothetical protein AB833_20810 [Chromatiales bacterium (ex Bugula neritina AB1)]